MAKRHVLDTVRYTSVGLFRMGREGIRELFEKAYEVGRGKASDTTVTASSEAKDESEE